MRFLHKWILILALPIFLHSTLYVPDPNGDVWVINTDTNTVTGTFSIDRVGAIDSLVTPDGSQLYVLSYDGGIGGGFSVIDIATQTVSLDRDEAGQPWQMDLSSDGSTLYISDVAGARVRVFETTTYSTTATINLLGDVQPIELTTSGDELYVGLNSFVNVIDTSNNTVTATIAGLGGPNSTGMAITPDDSKVYVTQVDGNDVEVINTNTQSVIDNISGLSGPFEMAITPNGNKGYITNSTANTVSVLDISSDTVIATITVGTAPKGVVVSDNGARVYVVCSTSGVVNVINTSTDTVAATISVAVGAQTLALSPESARTQRAFIRPSNRR